MHFRKRAIAPASELASDGRYLAETAFFSCPYRAWDLRQGRAAISLLLEAVSYARELDRSPWDFGVEIDALYETGLTASALRWLVCKGYAEHACELTAQGDAARNFRRSKGLEFGDRTCFVLTKAGLGFAREVFERSQTADSRHGVLAKRHGDGEDCGLRPIWDRQRRELRVAGVMVKQFKVPAANQEAILAAFDEEGWPVRVDDPLPPHPEQDPKRRLHDTINSLNRNQKHRLLRFMGDGSGEGVRWSLVPTSENGNSDGDFAS
ncbi:MAG: hypothetical protein RBS80_07155 [Thermoguttaceae bacterium]|jgi:hypothetical protein|nr:hypothetical protein [Thermoguttaceae bacterium]